jgi:RNA polymerase sigma-70 factor (ECF subfamily)
MSIDLVKQAQAGDGQAFDALMIQHKHDVECIAFKLMVSYNQDNLEDLTQEVWMQVFRKIKQFRGESSFRTWLYRLTFNTINMRYRSERNKRIKHSISLLENPKYTRFITTYDRRTEYAPEIDRMLRVINNLPKGYQRAVIDHELLGLEHHEIASKYGRSIGSSKSQLFKAKAVIKAKLLGKD